MKMPQFFSAFRLGWVFIALCLTAPCSPARGQNDCQLDFSEVIGLSVSVEDSGDGSGEYWDCGGSNNSRQVVSESAEVKNPDGSSEIPCEFTIAVTVSGSVEGENAGFDHVYVNDYYVFSSDEYFAGCYMFGKTSTIEIKIGGDKGNNISLTYDTVDGNFHTGGSATITNAVVVESPCGGGGGGGGSSCSTCNAGGGSPGPGPGFFGSGGGGGPFNSMGMGAGPTGGAPGFLKYPGGTPSAALTDPSILNYATANKDTEIIKDQDEALKQIKNNFVLVNVEEVDLYEFKVQYYNAADAGSKVDGLYEPTGDPFTTWIYENPDKTGSSYDTLLVKKVVGEKTKTYEFNWDATANAWEMVSNNGKKKELTSNEIDGPIRTSTYTIRNEEDEIVLRRSRVFETFPWGTELIAEIDDPDGEALTTIYTYFTDEMADGNNYSHLKHILWPSGYWERYEYDSLGRRAKTVKQFLDEPITAQEADSRVVTTTYQTGIPQEMTIETLLGEEISRSYRVNNWDSQFASSVTREVQCVEPGAAWNAASNLVTSTANIAYGEFEGRTSKVRHQDGTVSLFAYQINTSSGHETTTESRGEPNSSATQILKGTRTVTILDENGRLLERKTYDIETDLLIASEEHTLDDLGRTLEVTFLDETTEEYTYGTCGVATHTDRFGNVTEYHAGCCSQKKGVTRQGITTLNEEDAAGRVVKVTRIGTDESEIVLEENAYSISGRLVETTTPSGTTTFEEEIDSNGHTVRTTTYPDDSESIERYAPDGSLLETGGNASFPTKYEYGVDEDDGEFIKKILVGENDSETEWVQTFTDMAGRQWKTLYPDDAQATSHWNNFGQLERQVDADGVTTLFAYNSLGELEFTALDANANQEIDLEGNDRIRRVQTTYLEDNDETLRRTTHSEWGDQEIVVLETDSSLTSLEVWTRQYGYETHQLTALDGEGDYTITTEENTGRVATETYENGYLVSRQTTGQEEEEAGLVVMTYDPHGRLQSEQQSDLDSVVYTYFDSDRVQSATQGTRTTAYEYNWRGEQTKVTHAEDVETLYDYFPTGLLKEVSGALTYPVSYSYTPQGRMKTMTTTGQAGPSVTTWNYDPGRGWLSSKRYADNQGTDYTYTAAGRLQSRLWARNITTTYTYNAFGDLETVSYSAGAQNREYDFDRRGRITSMQQGDAIWTYGLNSAGQLMEESISGGPLSGLKVEFDYDEENRLITIQPEGNSAVTMGYTYDGASRLLTAATGSFKAEYSYEENSSRIKETAIRHNTALTGRSTREYDSLGRLKGISTRRESSPVISSHQYGYNALNQREEATLADGARWEYEYDSMGQVINGSKRNAAGTPVPGRQFGYEFDTIGNRLETLTNGRSADYTANTLNQYTARDVPPALDISGRADPAAVVTINGGSTVRQLDYFYREVPVNNTGGPQFPEITTQATKNALTSEEIGFEFLPANPENFSFDADGNLISDGRNTYTWDAENRLIALESIAGAPDMAKKKAEYEYDPQGRRIRKQVWEWSTVTNGLELKEDLRFLYHGWNLVAEVNASGDIVRSHLWGLDLSDTLQGAGGVGGLLCTTSHTTTPESWFPAFDGNGNIMAMVNTTSGEAEAVFEYDPFGRQLRATGPAALHSVFRFSTKYSDGETGFNYYGYRYYNPETGRWLNRDPLSEESFLNQLLTKIQISQIRQFLLESLQPTYIFVKNLPTGAVDPLGLKRSCSVSLVVAHSHEAVNMVEKMTNSNYKPKCGNSFGFLSCYGDDTNEMVRVRFGNAISGLPPMPNLVWPIWEQVKPGIDAARTHAETTCKDKLSCCKTVTVDVTCSAGFFRGLIGNDWKKFCGYKATLDCQSLSWSN